jgi:hypothetical protein
VTAGLYATIGQWPFFVGACVLFGFGLWGWRRTGATGALLIAVGGAVGALRNLMFAWHMMQVYSGRAPWKSSLLFGVEEEAGSLISEVLLIVGVALILRRLPARR